MSRVALLLLSCLLSLVVAEAVLRALRPEPPPPAGGWTGLVHRASELPGLDYELTPDSDKRARGMWIRTNHHGMRDDAPLAPGAGRRIAALGDSFTFGFFVTQEETWPSVLERRLAVARPETRWDVLNFGVGGYSTRDEALVLEHKALAFDPELVLVGYVLNDPEIDPVQPLQRSFHRPRGWERSELLRMGVRALDALRSPTQGDGEAGYLRSLYGNPRKWHSVERGLARIRELCAERGIEAVLIVFPTRPHRGPRAIPVSRWSEYGYEDIHARVARLGRELDFHTLDLLPVFQQQPLPAVMSMQIHPTPRGHAVAAEAILDFLQRRELLGAPPQG